MNINLKKFIKSIIIWLLLLLSVIVIWDSSIAIGGITAPKLGNPHNDINREANVIKILTVLKNKMGDRRLLEKAKDKLFTLSGRQTRLLASLSDRIAKDGYSAGADIAFLWITILIVLS